MAHGQAAKAVRKTRKPLTGRTAGLIAIGLLISCTVSYVGYYAARRRMSSAEPGGSSASRSKHAGAALLDLPQVQPAIQIQPPVRVQPAMQIQPAVQLQQTAQIQVQPAIQIQEAPGSATSAPQTGTKLQEPIKVPPEPPKGREPLAQRRDPAQPAAGSRAPAPNPPAAPAEPAPAADKPRPEPQPPPRELGVAEQLVYTPAPNAGIAGSLVYGNPQDRNSAMGISEQLEAPAVPDAGVPAHPARERPSSPPLASR